MAQKEIAFRIEDLETRMKMANSLQNALYTAIYGQEVFSKADFDWAFVLLGEMLHKASKELEELADRAIKGMA